MDPMADNSPPVGKKNKALHEMALPRQRFTILSQEYFEAAAERLRTKEEEAKTKEVAKVAEKKEKEVAAAVAKAKMVAGKAAEKPEKARVKAEEKAATKGDKRKRPREGEEADVHTNIGPVPAKAAKTTFCCRCDDNFKGALSLARQSGWISCDVKGTKRFFCPKHTYEIAPSK
jgi:hypothetical protein